MRIKWLLVGTLAILAILHAALAVRDLEQRQRDLDTAQRLIGHVQTSRYLVDAVQILAYERGLTTAVLHGFTEGRPDIANRRVQSNEAMRAVFASDITSAQNESLRTLWERVRSLRTEVDRALAGPPFPTSEGTAAEWLTVASHLVAELQRIVGNMHFDGTEVDAQTRELWAIASFSVRMRVLVGKDAAGLNQLLTGDSTLSPEEAQDHVLHLGRIQETWFQLRQRADRFAELPPLLDQVRQLYWTDFVALRGRVLADNEAGRPVSVSTQDYAAHIVPAVESIVEIVRVATDLLRTHAEQREHRLSRLYWLEAALFVSYLALILAAIFFIHFKVSRPLVALTQRLTAPTNEAPSTRRGHAHEIASLTRAVNGYLKSQETIRQSEERFRLASMASQDGIWDWDLTTGQIWFSSRWKEQLGYQDHELENTLDAWAALIFDEDRSKALQLVEDYNTGKIARFDVIQRFRHKDGSTVFIHSRAIHLMSPYGNPIRMVGAHTDITDQIRTERERENARLAAEAANEAKSRFIAVVSHELRTPLTGILGMSDMLLGSSLDPDQSRWASLIRRSGDSLLVLVNDILDFSKIEAGYIPGDEVNMRPSEIVREVVATMLPRAMERKLSISTEVTDVGIVSGQAHMLRRVLINLIGNAVKFTHNGRVHVSMTQTPAEDGLRQRLTFRVEDTGIGFNADQAKTLFEPFTQADGSTTRRFGGTGLGLAIAKRLCAAMGGEIDCHSEVGKGASFWFTVVVGPENPSLPSADGDGKVDLSILGQMPSLSLLVVEDNEVNGQLLCEALQSNGHKVHLATDGAAGVDAAMARDFDVIIMDMQMPVMDGLEATRVLRQKKGSTCPPIIALTADADVRRIDDDGLFLDVLRKPVNWELLAKTLHVAATGQAAAMTGGPSVTATASSLKSFSTDWLQPLLGQLPRERLNKIIESVLPRVETVLDELTDAITHGQMQEVARRAHALKGVSSQFGLERVADLALRMEEAAQTHPDLLPTLLADVKTDAVAAHAAINTYLMEGERA